MNLNQIANDHFESGARLGCPNQSLLASLALIAADLGDACDDTFEGQRLPRFGEKLADVMLRSMELARDVGINLEDVVQQTDIRWRNPSLHGCFADINVELAKCVNSARNGPPGDEFAWALGRLARRVMGLAILERVNLTYVIMKRRMAANAGRGTRT